MSTIESGVDNSNGQCQCGCQERISQLEQENKELKEIVRDLQETVSENFEYHSKKIADTNSRVTKLEEDVSDGQEDGGQTDESTNQQPSVEPETAVEDLVESIPSHAAEEHLDPTEERCHFILSDVVDYTKSVPAGRMMTSSEIKTILNAKEDEQTIYSQQVSRVIDVLETLGEGEIVVKDGRDSRGRRVVFTDELVQRLKKLGRNSGVTGMEVTG